MESILKILLLLLLLIFVSCVPDKKTTPASVSEDAIKIEREISDFHLALKRAYNGAVMNTDSLMGNFFGKDVYYVTYWGTSEPIDSTKVRLRLALPGMKEYDNRIESMNVKVYGDGAYAFFVLRQTYTLKGIPMENRWVVVHSQRSADFQTIQQLMKVAQQYQKPVSQEKK